MCLVLTLQLMNNYFHVRLNAGLFNTCQLNLRRLESSFGWQLMWRQNISTIVFHIWEKMKQGHFCKPTIIRCDKADATNFQTRLQCHL